MFCTSARVRRAILFAVEPLLFPINPRLMSSKVLCAPGPISDVHDPMFQVGGVEPQSVSFNIFYPQVKNSGGPLG